MDRLGILSLVRNTTTAPKTAGAQTDRITIPSWTRGDRLRKAREHAGIGVQEMADHLLVSRSTITNYESDTTHPTSVRLRRWSEVTGVPEEWLSSGITEGLDVRPSRCTGQPRLAA